MKQTSLLGIAKKAASDKAHRFQNLIGLLSLGYLLACWRLINKRAACGVDRQDARAYEQNLEEHVGALVEAVRGGWYRAKLVLRRYIPKLNGKLRPLGIPAVADKVLQMGVTKILEEIYEEDFLACSYGYRPNVGALDAVRDLSAELRSGRYHFLVEADIRSFFDRIDHDKLIDLLRKRIDDEPFLRLIRKWLKAGILETDGRVIHPQTGSPQGGIVTPRTQKVTSCLIGRLRSIVRTLCLTCAARGNIHMTHGALHRFAEGRTSQRCPWLARARAQRRAGLCSAVRSLRTVPPSGVPLRSGGAGAGGPGATYGAFGGGDVQVAAAPGKWRAGAGCGRPDDDQRDGVAGAVRLSFRPRRPWRIAATAPALSWSWNTPSIVCSVASWSRLTRSWCPSRPVPPAPDPG